MGGWKAPHLFDADGADAWDKRPEHGLIGIDGLRGWRWRLGKRPERGLRWIDGLHGWR
jgi:hypothetical protein